MKTNSSINQAIKRKFVEREVIYCVSSLVNELVAAHESFPEYVEDLMDAYRGLPDWEEAVSENGWKPFTDDYGVACWENEDGETWAGSAEDVCDIFDIDVWDYAPDVLEHWIVTDYLADKLEDHNERVLRDFFGLTVWCRCCSGQAILLDGVISEICSEMHILSGQENEWKA